MPEGVQRVCLWSGPRNVSTALMYSFAQRRDTCVVDEPLYAHYLSKTPARHYHPGADEVLAVMDNDGQRVTRDVILGPPNDGDGRKVRFFKNMTHHLVELDWSFLKQTLNVLLTRDPRDVLPSYANEVQSPTLEDVGYRQHVQLLEHLRALGQEPPVLDATQLLLDPRGVLMVLCERLGLAFDEAMLHWSPGPRREDGVWAKHWYTSVHQSTGFRPYVQKARSLTPRLEALEQACRPYYEELSRLAIRAPRVD